MSTRVVSIQIVRRVIIRLFRAETFRSGCAGSPRPSSVRLYA